MTDITLNPAMVNKIQNFFNDPAYREAIESASNYNARLSAERTMRLPFLDSQTGVAQNHSSLWMDARQRLPGMKEGQVYTYPSKRWRKKRRQYLNNFMQPRYPPSISSTARKEGEEPDAHTITTVENTVFNSPSGPASIHNTNEDSKDSSASVKEETQLSMKFEKEAWYYDDLDIPDAGEFEEPDADSDYDYEESYSKRKKKRGTPKSPRGGVIAAAVGGRGSKRKITYDPITDAEKPFACDLCGARYKTRPGLTYHYTHSHKDKEDEDEEEIPSSPRDDSAGRRGHSRGAPAALSLPPPVLHPQQQLGPMQLQPPTLQPQGPPPHHGMTGQLEAGRAPPSPGGSMPPPHMQHQHHPPPPHLVPQQQPPPHIQQQQSQGSNNNNNGSPQPPGPGTSVGRIVVPPTAEEIQQAERDRDNGKKAETLSLKPRVQPSTYCDFCLGDAAENKKSGEPEELVSCSDCGRSGHPSCLQFTPNMIISVKKYRWQCIECKCCSICGTSDNDDQLLFCDDCDRGYHMYCLKPALEAPPEGSWSCTLCLAEFHKK